jgi:hypothetical protein
MRVTQFSDSIWENKINYSMHALCDYSFVKSLKRFSRQRLIYILGHMSMNVIKRGPRKRIPHTLGTCSIFYFLRICLTSIFLLLVLPDLFVISTGV